MEQLGLNDYFENYLNKKSIFKNKRVLQEKYIPSSISHRKQQISQLASMLAPALKVDRPSNLFLYGKTGTGKTLCTKYIFNELSEVCKTKKIALHLIYVNCKLKKVSNTEYRIIAQFAREVGQEIPATGLPTEEVYNRFLKKINEKKQVVILALDEVDRLVSKLGVGDEILYNLTRLNGELDKAQLSIIGISNDLRFMERLDPRVKSSLSEEEIIFPPYNALQIKEILKERAKLAFNSNTISEGVLEKCAAYAAREHGDARRALDLLRVAGEIAERSERHLVTPDDIDKAEEKIERSRILEIARTQPIQSQITLYSIILLSEDNKDGIATGEVFEKYKGICKQCKLPVLTQRRVSDLISELDMLGIIHGRVISKGRYGRTREIYSNIPTSLLEKVKEVLEKEIV
ncbi:MAG: ORC1-type DNA replication protein [Candidatus Woesearchaeota archaeon]|nr:MAG: ORC1-type DNA replication protein [Candidatus Woesearchaeota archaeon]